MKMKMYNVRKYKRKWVEGGFPLPDLALFLEIDPRELTDYVWLVSHNSDKFKMLDSPYWKTLVRAWYAKRVTPYR